jgi:hypothetical protein
MVRLRPNPPQRDEDHNLLVTVKGGGEEMQRIPCKLWLPRRVDERPIMVLYPAGPRANLLAQMPPPFSIRGRIKPRGGHELEVWANEVWSEFASTRWLSGSRHETVVEASPIDLHVLRRPTVGKRRRRVRMQSHYHLTRCPAINTGVMRQQSYTGEVTIRKAWTFEFTLASGAQLTFAKHYQYENRDDGTLTWPELTAKHEREIQSRDFGRVDQQTLDELDDFLALVAFGSRFRTACVSIGSSTEDGDHFQFFRGNVTMPPSDQDFDSDDMVVDLSEFEEFLRTAYTTFIATGPHELVQHALHLARAREDRTVESSFTALYATLETLVLWYRRERGLEYIIEDDEKWQALKTDARRYLKLHAVLQGDSPETKERRKWIAAKVGELRRVPFGIAFHRFCKEYGVQLGDLWPVIDAKSGDVSLTEIRNRLVHGSTLNPHQLHALMGAEQHMRWTVERALLAVLGWPLERSKIRPAFLAEHLTAMTELQQDRAAMREPAPGDAVAIEAEVAAKPAD